MLRSKISSRSRVARNRYSRESGRSDAWRKASSRAYSLLLRATGRSCGFVRRRLRRSSRHPSNLYPPCSTSWVRADRPFSQRRTLQQQGREFIGHVEHHIMPACKLLPPPAALSCLGVKLAERTVKATRQNVSDVCDAVAGAADLRRRFKTGQRVHRALAVHP